MKTSFAICGAAFALVLTAQVQAASRVVHFAAVTQSHLRADNTAQNGSGKVLLTCLISVRNVSTTSVQEITGINLVVKAGVPTNAAIQPSYKTQKGDQAAGGLPLAPAFRSYRLCSSSNCAPNASAAIPTAAAPLVLATSAAAGNLNTVHFRDAAGFQYRTTAAFDDGAGNPQNHQNVMFQCTGSITVRDQSTGIAGAVIASGVAEAVVNDYQQTQGIYGARGFTDVASTDSYQWNVLTDRQREGGAFNSCGNFPVPGFGCSGNGGDWGCAAVGVSLFQTGPGAGSWGGHLQQAGLSFSPPAAASTANYGGDTTPTNLFGELVAGVWGVGNRVGVNKVDHTYSPPGPPRTYNSFPQEIQSVPFLVNGGKPF